MSTLRTLLGAGAARVLSSDKRDARTLSTTTCQQCTSAVYTALHSSSSVLTNSAYTATVTTHKTNRAR
jgi:hypothetical protein